MKKLLCLIISVVMLCQMSAFAEVITAEFEYDSVLNGFTVSGTSSDTKDFDEITVEAYYNDIPFDVVITETKKAKEGNTFEADMIYVDKTLDSGEIYFKVFSAHQAPVETEKFTYSGITEIYPVLKELAGKLKSNDTDGFISVASLNKDKLLVDSDSVNSFGQLSIQAVKNYFKNISYTLPSACVTEAEKKAAFECLSYLRGEFENGVVIGKMLECDNTSELSSWYSEYKDLLNLKAFDVNRYKYFEDNMSNEKMLSFLKGASTAFASFDDFKKRIIGLGGLCAIESGSAASVASVFADFSEQITKLYSLSQNQEPSLFLQIAGTENATFEILSNLYNQLAYAYLYSQQQGGGQPSSSMGGGGSSSSGGSSIVVEPIVTPSKTSAFTDMNNAKWAEEAVYALYEKGIVSGRTANTFAPNDNITRAEFAKLLVALKGAQNSNLSVIFTDVNPSDWFFGYVNSAYDLDITKGYEDGTFRPYDNITREDMAVMIYRYLGEGSTASDLSVFSDSAYISDYAKKAVSYLYENNIISGMGDGTFSPKSNATRAQAAQMIYNFIK